VNVTKLRGWRYVLVALAVTVGSVLGGAVPAQAGTIKGVVTDGWVNKSGWVNESPTFVYFSLRMHGLYQLDTGSVSGTFTVTAEAYAPFEFDTADGGWAILERVGRPDVAFRCVGTAFSGNREATMTCSSDIGSMWLRVFDLLEGPYVDTRHPQYNDEDQICSNIWYVVGEDPCYLEGGSYFRGDQIIGGTYSVAPA
jgi:hypothetical protein